VWPSISEESSSRRTFELPSDTAAVPRGAHEGSLYDNTFDREHKRANATDDLVQQTTDQSIWPIAVFSYIRDEDDNSMPLRNGPGAVPSSSLRALEHE
jgi:hypothetical protein